MTPLSDNELRHLEVCFAPDEDIRTRAVAEIRRLREQIEGHAGRIAAQSEILSRRAEKNAAGLRH